MRPYVPCRTGPKRRHPRRHILAGAALLIATWLSDEGRSQETEADQKVWNAGAYSFSDELGGFRITSVSGTGTREDPFVIKEELQSATPVTLTIRTTRPIRPFDSSGFYASGIMFVRVEALNNSGQAWVEFEFELQELQGHASVFGDGLSFDQRRTDNANISSDSFAQYSRDFEPYDRLRYTDGKVDPRAVVGFSFLVTDYTPRWRFYLVQDPRIPSS
ncbi:hypothetical protein WHT83_11890 [Aminobacter sp. P9b]|uniref:hypothetical protein n=1 Tax=Aminobacter TaxID=31988 RepID=UPI000D386082|nr:MULTISPECIES: hypothetical protein [Aminobacter]